MKINFIASNRQYIDHLVPIWKATALNDRGRFFVPNQMLHHATLRGINPQLYAHNDELERMIAKDQAVVVVANYADLHAPWTAGLPAVLVEHGIGQSFVGDDLPINLANPGGGGPFREAVKLFIVPNFHAAAQNQRTCPDIPNAVVGCPKLDAWVNQPGKGPIDPDRPVIAFGFHWNRQAIPEARSAFPYYRDALQYLAFDCNNGALPWKLLGHGHPKQWGLFKKLYTEMGIEPVEDFDEVVRRADVYVNDCSSTLYEFAASSRATRPVVVLNIPDYRRDVTHGLRFWEASFVGPNVNDPADLQRKIEAVLAPRERWGRERYFALEKVYAFRDGSSSARAVTAIKDMIHTLPGRTY
jgi:hypothetical protein